MLKWLPPQSLFPDLKQVVTYFDAKKEATKNLTRQVFKKWKRLFDRWFDLTGQSDGFEKRLVHCGRYIDRVRLEKPHLKKFQANNLHF